MADQPEASPMDLQIELVDQGGNKAKLPENTYVLAVSGGSRKLSRCDPAASVHLIKPGRACNMNFYQLLGQCRIDLSANGKTHGVSPVMNGGLVTDMHMKWSSAGEIPSVDNSQQAQDDKKHDMKTYMESQGVETLLAEAVCQLLKARPSDARKFLAEYFANAVTKEQEQASPKQQQESLVKQPDGLMVINGFYMSMRDCYTRPGAKIHYFDVEWESNKVSWHDFRQQVLGATDPDASEPNSLRGIIKSSWRSLGLHHAPTIRDNGVHASASPFEALVERANWLQHDMANDPLGQVLVEAGVTLETQKEWASDPQVEWHRENRSLFDLLEDLDAKELIQKAARLIHTEPSDEVLSRCPRNRAFVFVKPHAAVGNGSVETLVREKLTAAGLTIIAEASIDNATIDENKLIDKHYGAIASKASLLKPEQTAPSQAAKEQFGMKFGMPWEKALAEGCVFNALDACKKLGIDGDELGRLWNEAKDNRKLIKFGGGFYCALLPAAPSQPKPDALYVINGFYMSMRDLYTVAPASIHYFDVEWDRDAVTWVDFRQSILGATDPDAAAPGSLRNVIKEQWETLGLQKPPNMKENGVHASASPFEAMVERANWLEADLESDPLSQALSAAGVPVSTQIEWAKDVQVAFEGKTTSIFDVLEDLDVWPLMGRAARIVGQHTVSDDLKASCPRNRAFVFVKPHAVVPNGSVVDLVRNKFTASNIEIKSEGSIGYQAIDEKKLIDKHYGAIAAKASLLKPSETNPTTKAKENFGMTFGSSWDQALASNQVVNAVDACKILGINGAQMAGLWEKAQAKGEFLKFGGGFYCAKLI